MRQSSLIGLEINLADLVGVEPLDRGLPTRSTHACAESLVAQKLQACLSESLRLLGRHEEAGDAILDHVTHGTDSRRNKGNAAGLSLERRGRGPLGPRQGRDQVDVERRIQLLDICSLPREDDGMR
jgi:hypothetical protein